MSTLPVLRHFNLYVKHRIRVLNPSKNPTVVLIGIALNMKILPLFQLFLASSNTIQFRYLFSCQLLKAHTFHVC